MTELRYEMDVGSMIDGATVVVLLHGRGSDRKDLLGLRPGLPAHAVLVTPEAPHPARPWGYGPGWAWYRYLAEDRVDQDTLDYSLEALDHLLGTLEDSLPARPGRLVLGGFSQGGTTSLAYALRHPGRVHGVINFSGFLAEGALASAAPAAVESAPLFWGHGTRDPNIPHAMAERGRSTLREAGADLTSRDYEIGHWIAPEELADAVVWMEGLGAGRAGP